MVEYAQYLEATLPLPVKIILFVGAMLLGGMLAGFAGLAFELLLGPAPEGPPDEEPDESPQRPQPSLCSHDRVGEDSSGSRYCWDCRDNFGRRWPTEPGPRCSRR
jgi:hypothetical protein